MAGQRRRIGASNAAAAADGSGVSTSTRQARWQPTRFMALVACASFILQAPTASAFSSVTMTYKPQVKSSVSKLRSSRFTEHRPGTSSPQSRSPTSKSAYAGALAAPPGLLRPQQPQESFERRMRDLVLGSPSPTKKPATTVQKPANIMTVETLADYKRVVADEKDRVVAVRFHGEWCRVSKPAM